MESEDVIRLERSPDQPNKDVLVGLNGDIIITERIVRAVEASGRLFPYVVEHIAGNRLANTDLGAEERYKTRKGVRDELLTSIQGLRRQRDPQRVLQSRNMTDQVDTARPPYFAR